MLRCELFLFGMAVGVVERLLFVYVLRVLRGDSVRAPRARIHMER